MLERFVSEYLTALPLESLPASCRQLIEWAQRYVTVLRESVSPDKLAIELGKHNLMDDSAQISSWISFDW
jgi:hypothetical protein